MDNPKPNYAVRRVFVIATVVICIVLLLSTNSVDALLGVIATVATTAWK